MANVFKNSVIQSIPCSISSELIVIPYRFHRYSEQEMQSFSRCLILLRIGTGGILSRKCGHLFPPDYIDISKWGEMFILFLDRGIIEVKKEVATIKKSCLINLI